MKKLFDATVWKFLLVGVANTLVGSGVMFLLYNLAHVHYWWRCAPTMWLGAF